MKVTCAPCQNNGWDKLVRALGSPTTVKPCARRPWPLVAVCWGRRGSGSPRIGGQLGYVVGRVWVSWWVAVADGFPGGSHQRLGSTVGHMCVVGRRHAKTGNKGNDKRTAADDGPRSKKKSKHANTSHEQTQEQTKFWAGGVLQSFVNLTNATRQKVSPSLCAAPATPSHAPRARTNGPAAALSGDQISKIAPKNVNCVPQPPFFEDSWQRLGHDIVVGRVWVSRWVAFARWVSRWVSPGVACARR